MEHKEPFLLIKALEINPQKHRLIGVVGAGGKTSLIFELARELKDIGLHVAVTMTTHMEKQEKYGFQPIGVPCENEQLKIRGISPRAPAALLDTYDVVLVEADGSRHLPFKVPAGHEPVLPERAELIIGVAGASAIGQPFYQACCRAELACKRFHCCLEDRITFSHLVESLAAPWGQKKDVICDYRFVVNQIDYLTRGQITEILQAVRENRKSGVGCCISVLKRIVVS